MMRIKIIRLICITAFMLASIAHAQVQQVDSLVTDTTQAAEIDTLSQNETPITTDSIAELTVADSIVLPIRPKIVELVLSNKDFEYKDGEMISSVACIKNFTDSSQTLKLSIDLPQNWRTLTKTTKTYTLLSGDSVFVPIRIIPEKEIGGNVRFLIDLFLTNQDNEQAASSYIWIYTKRKSSWTLTALPQNKIYFKHDENTADFGLRVHNTGNEKQSVTLTLEGIMPTNVVKDSSGKIISKNKQTTMSLLPDNDTTIKYTYTYLQGARNKRMVDTEGYRPDNTNEERVYYLQANTVDPSNSDIDGYRAGQRLQFVKLSDSRNIEPNNDAYLPLTVDININNLLSDVTFTSINLRGNTQFSNEDALVYNFLSITNSGSYENLLNNSVYYAGYFTRWGNVQAGYINGGIMGVQTFGRGVRTELYRGAKRQHRVSLFYTNDSRFQRAGVTSAGATYAWRFRPSSTARVEYARIYNDRRGLIMDVVGGGINFTLLKTQTFNIRHASTFSSFNNPTNTPQSTIGNFTVFNYTGAFIKRKLITRQFISRSDKNFSAANVERLFYQNVTNYRISNKLGLLLNTNYIDINSGRRINTSKSLINQLGLNFMQQKQTFQPFVFYNQYRLPFINFNQQGVGINYNFFEVKDGTRAALQVRSGSNINTDTTTNAIPFYQINTFFVYRTISAFIRYNSGDPFLSTRPTNAFAPTVRPQLLNASLTHQYVFNNTRFILQSNGNYLYNNVMNQHSINLFPELLYFTTTGWRLRAGLNYNFVRGKRMVMAGTLFSEEDLSYVNQNTFLFVGIRKDFMVPIPFVRNNLHNLKFEAFYDLNGDGKKDKNETSVDNIIIDLGGYEVLTNSEGIGHINNIPTGVYPINIKLMDAYDGWFANIFDTIIVTRDMKFQVPFVRGVKIKGKVKIDREAIRADAQNPFDLTNILISAIGYNKTYNTLTDFDGNFEFYLPYGEYKISMSESILGEKYKLARNNLEIIVRRENEGMMLSFLIIENKRKVIRKSFNGKGK
jgi:hypothetical protein